MAEDIKAKFLRIVDEAWNQGHLDLLNELHSIGYIEHHPPFPDVEGLDAFKQMVASAHIAYSGFHLTIHEVVLEGDMLAARWTWTGTHSGQTPGLPIPPTGKTLTVSGLHFLHFDGDKLVEGWQFADNLGMLQQLNLIPKIG